MGTTCFRCGMKVSEKKTGWHNGKTYCNECCNIVTYFSRLKRNWVKNNGKRS